MSSAAAPEEAPLGAVEHLKTLCRLGLPPEGAMVAATPLLHEIIPHGWSCIGLLEPDGTIGRGYSENPASATIFRERLWRFLDDSSSPMSLWMPCFRANGISWTLHLQGRQWLDSAYYREIEVPLDSCWILDAMIGEAGRSFALANLKLTRPRGARPFTVDHVRRFDRLRPWLAHAFRRPPSSDAAPENLDLLGMAGAPVLSGEMTLTPGARIVYQTPGLEFLLRRVLEDVPLNHARHVLAGDTLPPAILKLLRCIGGGANGASNTPPRMQVSSPYGVVTLEAKWLMPAGALHEDVARDPNGCLIAVTIELREHAIAHAARILRESGATPAQVKVGIQLALG
ncbi:MAG: hypothetical protein ACRETH_13410, partial [Steroidobacteraceae bacterium]